MSAATCAARLPDKAEVRSWLSRIRWGSDAASYAGFGQRVLLPLFAATAEPVGRTGRHEEIMIRWQNGTVTEPGAHVRWCYPPEARRETSSCSTPACPVWNTCTISADGTVDGSWPNDAGAPRLADGNQSVLTADGETAMFEFLYALTDYVLWSLGKQNHRKAHALNSFLPMSLYWDESMRTVIDGTTAEHLVSVMLYGDPEANLRPVVRNLIGKIAAGRYDTVPIATVLETNIRTDSANTIDRAIGEAGTLGPRIRAVAEHLGTTDPQRIVDHFRIHWPKDRLGRQRVIKALTAGPMVEAHTLTNVPEDFLDLALIKHARPRHSSVQTHSASNADPDDAAVKLVKGLIGAAGAGQALDPALLWNRYTSAGFPGGEIDPDVFFDAYELLHEMAAVR